MYHRLRKRHGRTVQENSSLAIPIPTLQKQDVLLAPLFIDKFTHPDLHSVNRDNNDKSVL